MGWRPSEHLSRPKPLMEIKPCPLCGRKPMVKESMFYLEIRCGTHHRVLEPRMTGYEDAGDTRRRAVERWNSDVGMIDRCIDVIVSIQHNEKTIRLLGDRTYSKELLQSILNGGHDIEFI